MVAAQRITLLNTHDSALETLAEYFKDPSLVTRLRDEVKSLNSLTEQEEKKAEEARKAIALYEVQKKELEAQKNKLEADKLDHKEITHTFYSDVSNVSKQNEAKELELKQKEAKLSDAINAHAANVEKLDFEKANLVAKTKAALDEITAEKNALEKTKTNLDARATDLAKAEQAFKEKSAALTSFLAK